MKFEFWTSEDDINYAAMGLLFYILEGGLDEEVWM